MLIKCAHILLHSDSEHYRASQKVLDFMKELSFFVNTTKCVIGVLSNVLSGDWWYVASEKPVGAVKPPNTVIFVLATTCWLLLIGPL